MDDLEFCHDARYVSMLYSVLQPGKKMSVVCYVMALGLQIKTKFNFIVYSLHCFIILAAKPYFYFFIYFFTGICLI